jgi:hypothetical protein
VWNQSKNKGITMSDKLDLIERMIDEDYEDLDIFKLKKSDALLMACQVFERKARNIEYFYYQIPSDLITVSVGARELAFDLHDGIALLIRWIMDRCKESSPRPSKGRLLAATEAALKKATEHAKIESLFKPYRKGLFNGEVLDSTLGKECIRFSYATESIALYEAMNEQILQEQANVKYEKMRKLALLTFESFTPFSFPNMKRSASRWLDLDFELPNNYRIGPYTIEQIKRIWSFVVTKAIIENTDNQHRALPTLMELHYSSLEFIDTPVELVDSLLEDLTFSGIKKNKAGKRIFTSLQTEPILSVKPGIKIISPKLILQYQPARNIISTLNRIYGDEASVDSDKKERVFVSDLNEISLSYENLITSSTIPINDTDVDYAVYDKTNGVLMVAELKWFNEPVSSAEISSKDTELQKALLKQLPNYLNGISADTSSFMIKAFQRDYPVNDIVAFVMTRGSIGSGRIQIPEFKIINVRMYRRALVDTNGDLLEAIKRLQFGDYYPRVGINFEYAKDVSNTMGGVKIFYEGHSVTEHFSLLTQDDEYANVGGHKIPIHKSIGSLQSEDVAFYSKPQNKNRAERRGSCK